MYIVQDKFSTFTSQESLQLPSISASIMSIVSIVFFDFTDVLHFFRKKLLVTKALSYRTNNLKHVIRVCFSTCSLKMSKAKHTQ